MNEVRSGQRRPMGSRFAARVGGFVPGLLLALSLAACGSSSAPESFDLSASSVPGAPRAARRQIVVAEPLATSPTDSDRIVVRPTPDTLATLKGAQWVERLPRLLQTRMVQSFENAKLSRSVGRPEAKIQADYSLASEIRRFEIDVAGGEAIVEISVKLVAEGSGRVVAAQIFSTRAPGSANGGAEAAAALDLALGDALRQIVAWTASRL